MSMSASSTTGADARIKPVRSRPLPDALVEPLKRRRREIVRLELRGATLPLLFPSDAYAIMFLRSVDPTLIGSIRTIIADRRRRLFDEPGVIYVFWVRGQPANQFKIGRSVNPAEQRVSDWGRSIGPRRRVRTNDGARTIDGDGAAAVRLLYSFPTRFNALAETLVHTTLAFEQVAKLRHPTSGRELTEFFVVDNVLALRLFIALVVRFADRLGDDIVAQRRSKIGI